MPGAPAIGPKDRRPSPRPLLRGLLGDALRRIRREQGRTLADVAHAAQMSMQYLSELERGRKEASSEILAALCDSLDIELPDLLADVRWPVVDARERRASVVRLESTPIASPPSPSRTRSTGAGDAYCLAA